MPMVCWAPLIGAAYEVLKPIMSSRSKEGSPHWWENQGIIYNRRKRLVQEGVLDPSEELEYLDVVLTITRNCKSAGVWHHRKWLICFMNPTIDTTPLDIDLIERHLAACHRAAELYPKCYYAWTTRHWLVDQLSRTYKVPLAPFVNTAQVENTNESSARDPLNPAQRSMIAEWQRMSEHVERNVSDHSSFQHFQHVLLKMSGRYAVHEDPYWSARRPNGQNNDDAGTEAATGQRSLSRPTHNDGSIALCWDREALRGRRHRHRGRIQAQEQQFESSSLSPQQQQQQGEERYVHTLWRSEADRVRRLVEDFPGHETLWYHLRFVYYGLRWLDSGVLDGEDIGATTTATSTEYVTPETERFYVQRILGHNVEEEEEEDQDTTEKEGANHSKNKVAAHGVLVGALKAQEECSRRYLTWVNRLDL
ncbi:Protein prenyltransferase alpha subunit repeat-containing protein 1 [Actinomortierella ambigua]|uniref:Protein prenyltransferase alpha subunit repeat-containing protein 1 n=1 Tax=Actinomortierella ambigua TaxID=1343610 RepID=A0A9P6UAV3_9FUNG|nr:Protein prenyltransferase alpha subunit repeat-containing protein 1 [Actinomortierella ambigua]